MLHKNSADKFSFEDCKFTVQRSKESTGKKEEGQIAKERGRWGGREREIVTWRGIDDIDRSIRKW
jgi:hypothetical protein